MPRRIELYRTLLFTALFAAGLMGLPFVPACAQFALPTSTGHATASNNAPVTFSADQVDYDREHSLVIARGMVEAWQNDHVLRADQVVFNRNTGVATATGHIALLEPDGEMLFANSAVLSNNMRDGVFNGVGALLAQNGRMAANGGRRTNGELNELSKVVYSSCDLCTADPTKAPLWQLRARSGVQDVEHKMIEYYDATLEIDGLPVAYFPFLAAPDPSTPRQSGFIVPWAGNSSNVGAFVGVP